MNKTFKLLQLINLLNNRRYVTLETIMRTCNIPKRTAYRYLNAISDANIPVYFDRQARAYCLSCQRVLNVDDLSLSEAVINTIALRLFSSGVNAEYRNDIENLIIKVTVRQPFPVEDVLLALDRNCHSAASHEELSDLLSSALVHAAVMCKRKVRLMTMSSCSGPTKVEIDNPSLLFHKNWQLVESRPPAEKVAQLKEIRKVTIL